MSAYLVEGFTLGLTLAGSCLATCGPIYAPVLLMEKRTFLKNLLIVLEITAGRFFTYAIFGALAGYLGQQIPEEYRDWLTSISYLILAVLLLYMLLPKKNVNHSGCSHKKMAMSAKRFPFWLGVVTGISICPSFLLALSQAVDLAGIWQGMLFFIAFFGGTTLIILPMAFIGFLPRWRMDIVKKIGIILTIPVAVWFGYRGIVKIIELTVQPQIIAFTETRLIYIINESSFDSISCKLSDRLSHKKINVIQISGENFNKLPDTLLTSGNYILRLHRQLLSEEAKVSLKDQATANNVYLLDFHLPDSLQSSYADTLLGYLDFYRFKVKDKGFYFLFN